jgi:hypothetical protein
MTHAVAATSAPATTAETQRTRAGRTDGASYAEFQAAAAKDSDKTSSSDAKTSASSGDAPKNERTQAVKGHSYKEIVSGPRNGMFINNTGNRRDGEAFLIVKRHGREFHIYGTGEERKVYEVGRTRDASTDSGTATSGTSATGTTGTGASGTGTTGTGSTAATGTATTGTTGTTSTS